MFLTKEMRFPEEMRYNENGTDVYDPSREFAHVSEGAKEALRREEEQRNAREEEIRRKAEEEARRKMENLPPHIAREFARRPKDTVRSRRMTPAKAREFARYSNSLVRLMLRLRAKKATRWESEHDDRMTCAGSGLSAECRKAV